MSRFETYSPEKIIDSDSDVLDSVHNMDVMPHAIIQHSSFVWFVKSVHVFTEAVVISKFNYTVT